MTQFSNNSAMSQINALNDFVEKYQKSAVVNPRSWDDELLFRKYQSSSSLDLEARQRVAVKKFLSNITRLRNSLVEFENVTEFDFGRNDFDQVRLLKDARSICHDLFRPWSKLTMHNTVNRLVEFPTGAGYVTRRALTRGAKYHKGISVTGSALKYAVKYLRDDVFAPNAISDGMTRNITIVPGNRFITVPKNTETERLICIEPEVNSYYQKGIGAFLKHVMVSRAGLDLSDQSMNRVQCADFSFSTIDLSSASDSVSYELVKFLLPRRVFNMLAAFRSAESTLFGHTIRHNQPYSLFSTMGNGYTFELESLIFYCLARAATVFHDCDPVEVCVFGDDLIVRNSVAPTLVELLEFTGFSVNEDKSFIGNQPKRESCGFFFEETPMGVQLVSPLAIKGAFSTQTLSIKLQKGGSRLSVPVDPELIRVHNEMVRYLGNTNLSLRNDKLARFYRACIKKIRALFPAQFQGRGYYGETQYLLSDTLCLPAFELRRKKRRGRNCCWSNRLLGKGLNGPSSHNEDGKIVCRRIDYARGHRALMAFGHRSEVDGEFSTHHVLSHYPWVVCSNQFKI